MLPVFLSDAILRPWRRIPCDQTIGSIVKAKIENTFDFLMKPLALS